MEERENIIAKIGECLASFAGDGEFTEGTGYAALGLKSANYSQMINILEDEFDVEIPYMDFKRCKTVGESADLIGRLIDG